MPMRVVVTGATGFVGGQLVRELNERNHRVVVLTRDPVGAAHSLPLVEAIHAFDPAREPAPAAALEGADAIVHLAGESVSGRWTDEKKRAIRDSRVIGTRNLVEGLAAVESRPRVLVSSSAVGFYGERGDEELDEDAGPGADFLATVAVEWETEAARATDFGLRVVSLRTGIVLGHGGGALQQMLLPFRLGLGGPMGSGDQWWSWIHMADLIRLILSAIEQSWSGSYNATAPEPERQASFARQLGRALGRPAILPAPAFALRLVLGEFASELLTSHRVLPRRALEQGFGFRYGRLDEALADLLP
jgi:uncharacterized protein (TIGR01777 family)